MSNLAGSTTSTTSSSASSSAGSAVKQARALVFSDDRAVRDHVMRSVGRKPARDVEITEWDQFATPAMAAKAVKENVYDVLVLDGEASPMGGMGLSRQLKAEVYDCPPVVLLTARQDDAWLAAWSYAERAVPRPLDPVVLASAVADVVRDTDGVLNLASGKVDL